MPFWKPDMEIWAALIAKHNLNLNLHSYLVPGVPILPINARSTTIEFTGLLRDVSPPYI
jgi:hypothetical protein